MTFKTTSLFKWKLSSLLSFKRTEIWFINIFKSNVFLSIQCNCILLWAGFICDKRKGVGGWPCWPASKSVWNTLVKYIYNEPEHNVFGVLWSPDDESPCFGVGRNFCVTPPSEHKPFWFQATCNISLFNTHHFSQSDSATVIKATFPLTDIDH